MIVKEITCKSILTRSGIQGVDYALNPYVGCSHGCVYCYATFMKRFTGHSEEWGTFVDVKVNAAVVLARQLARIRAGNITLGTVTDAYQPLEEDSAVTRDCLQVLVGYPGPITILTKSTLVLRDLDLIKQLKDVEVAFTITTPDDDLARQFEPGASPVSQRLDALRVLASAGISTWAFCGPLLPFLSDSEPEIDTLFSNLKAAGVSYVLVDSLNLRGAAWGRVRNALAEYHPDLVESYAALKRDRTPYHRALMTTTQRLAAVHGLSWKGVHSGGRDL